MESSVILPSMTRPRRAAVGSRVTSWLTPTDVIADEIRDRARFARVLKVNQLVGDGARRLVARERGVTLLLNDRRAEVERLVRQGHVEAARAVSAFAGADLGDWAALLAPPSTTTRPPSGRSDFRRNVAWLQAHRESNRGMWVALRDGVLIDRDESRAALQRRLTAANASRGILLVKVDR